MKKPHYFHHKSKRWHHTRKTLFQPKASMTHLTFKHFPYTPTRHSQSAHLGWPMALVRTAHLYQTTSWNLPHWNVVLADTASWHNMANFRVEQCLQHSPMKQETVLLHWWKLNAICRLLLKALSQALLHHRLAPPEQGYSCPESMSTERKHKEEHRI